MKFVIGDNDGSFAKSNEKGFLGKTGGAEGCKSEVEGELGACHERAREAGWGYATA